MRYVYVIRNEINQKVYVGQTGNPDSRQKQHFRAARRGDKHPLYDSIRCHGENCFTFEIIEKCDESLINEREKFWVEKLGSTNREVGYNLTSGGDQNFKHTEETKCLIRQKRASQIITDEHRRRISEGLRRTSSDEEIRRKRREGQAKRLPPMDETKRLASESNKLFCKNNREAMLQTRQKPRRCSICNEFGHNKKNCKEKSK